MIYSKTLIHRKQRLIISNLHSNVTFDMLYHSLSAQEFVKPELKVESTFSFECSCDINCSNQIITGQQLSPNMTRESKCIS